MKTLITLALVAVSISSAIATRIEAQLIGVPHHGDVPNEVVPNTKGIDYVHIPAITLANGQTKGFKVNGDNYAKIDLNFTRNNSVIHGTAYIATPTRNGKVTTISKQFTVSTTDSTIPWDHTHLPAKRR